MIPLAGFIIGAVLGAIAGRDGFAVIAFAVVGLIVGFLLRAMKAPRADSGSAATSEAASEQTRQMLVRLYTVEQRMLALERRLARVSITADMPTEGATTPPPETAPATAPAEVPSATSAPTGAPSTPDLPAAPAAATPPIPQSIPAYLRTPALTSSPPPAAAEADIPLAASAPGVPSASKPTMPPAPNPIWAWITGGNTLARVGILVLLVGVGLLLKYAAQHIDVPISLRLAGVAAGGVALLVVGWVLRLRRFAYAMILQGGGVAVLYLTVFAALRLYALLSPEAAFTLLATIAALSAFLAVRQDALALAAIGVLGGFLAPILTSTARGDHVMLFFYYSLLNAAIFGIAWFKAWRVLNLLGFACTFIIGTLWGVTRYRPEDFSTTEPFLILFFLFYVGIAVFYALRRSLEVQHPIDGTIVFGTPLVAAALQSALVRNFEYGLAFSAVGAAAVYLALGWFLFLRKRDALRLMCQAFLGLGIVFATLAVPLAFDARWTSATWALEGAAMVYIGQRERHAGPRAFGLLLELAAGIALLFGAKFWMEDHELPRYAILNRDFLGALIVAVAGLVTARLYGRNPDCVSVEEGRIAPVAFLWGSLWWFGGGWLEIDRFVTVNDQLAVGVAFLAASAVGFTALARYLRWPMARFATFAVFPALFVIAAGFALLHSFPVTAHLLQHAGIVAWPIALALMLGLLKHYGSSTDAVDSVARELGHALTFGLFVLIASDAVAGVATSEGLGSAWRTAGWGFVPALVLAIVSLPQARNTWPVRGHARAYLAFAGVPVVVSLLLWSLTANVASDGSATPLGYLPLANPLDVTQAIVIVACVLWFAAIRDEALDPGLAIRGEALGALIVAVVWWWLTMTLLRTVHQWGDVSWTSYALWRSMVAQAALSLLWTAFALVAMVVSYRRALRAGWFAGAGLLVVVVLKLVLVDLSHIGTVERIVSFIGVGLLILLIAYLAPVPPRRKETPA